MSEKGDSSKLQAKFEELSKVLDGWGYIAFLIDREADLSAPMYSKGISVGDALVCIERIVRIFGISPAALYKTLFGGDR